MDLCTCALLDKLKKKRSIKKIPEAPKMKIIALRDSFKKEPIVIEALDVYEFFKKVPESQKLKENEFRKNVCLRIIDNKETRIDMDKLKEYSEILERFIKFVRAYLS
ncbi:hypothetical protein A3K73_06355 [Candidatus Pacearchaeota archaeon RBG_13_36_9]|nr:MAG: hypothetical protein A3K73_06355 [Candidatus Pacearchaeota archaeon RBG_13_36_9]